MVHHQVCPTEAGGGRATSAPPVGLVGGSTVSSVLVLEGLAAGRGTCPESRSVPVSAEELEEEKENPTEVELTEKQKHQLRHRELFLSRQYESLPATHIRYAPVHPSSQP